MRILQEYKFLNQKLRREKQIYTKFKKRNPHANEDFRKSLINLIENNIKNSKIKEDL